jgi:hypothetical protein
LLDGKGQLRYNSEVIVGRTAVNNKNEEKDKKPNIGEKL